MVKGIFYYKMAIIKKVQSLLSNGIRSLTGNDILDSKKAGAKVGGYQISIRKGYC